MLSLALALAAASSSPALLPPYFHELLELTDRPITAYIPTDVVRTHPAGDALVLYMNRFGGSYTCGGNGSVEENDAATNQSSIACADVDGIADITPYAGNDAQWGEVMSCLNDMFAPFRLPVTDIEPLPGTVSYVEAVIGGTPDQAGMEQGVGGVAPYACEVIPGAIVYVFSDYYGDDTRVTCEVAAQEIAHAFGLDHEFLCEDPLTYLEGCGEKAFVDEYVPCGEFEPRECTCATPTQNSVQAMLELFGPADGTVFVPPVDQSPPLLDVLEPADGAILAANEIMTIAIDARDDVGLTVVELEWDFSGERMFCPANGGSYTCVREETRYVWTVNVGIGNRTFRAHIRDVAGNELTSDDVSVWLSTDGSGPPNDTAAPSIILGAPMAGAIMPIDSPFEIVASILDDNGIARAELNWPRGGEDRWTPCPYANERMTCVVEGHTYRWTVLRTREGARTIALRAADVVGNEALIEDIRLEMTANTPEVISDGNDTIDEATTIKCGETVDVDGVDADWFTIDAPAGFTVTVAVADPTFGVVATNGATVLEGSKHVVAASPLSFAITPPDFRGGATTLTVGCTAPPEEPKPEGCAFAGTPSLLAMLAIAFRLRRRRA